MNRMQATAVVNTDEVPLFAAALLEPGEIVVGMWHPSLWYIPFRSVRMVTALLLAGITAAVAADLAQLDWLLPIVQCTMVLVLARVAWVSVDWASRLYVLTDRRVLRRRGLVNATVYQVELRRLRRIDLRQSWPARLVGAGTINFSQRLQGEYDAAWVLAPRATALRRLVIETKQRYR